MVHFCAVCAVFNKKYRLFCKKNEKLFSLN